MLDSPTAPVATTTSGKVRGSLSGDTKVFKGIPYGASTAGAGRFQPPQPPQAWSGIRDALAFAPMSPQSPRELGGLFKSWGGESVMSEDCLAINVWTPALDDGGKRPVMVWFHGGDFSSLSGSRNVFDGTRLSQKGDVVVVTLNHRLNAFGFLYLGQLAPQFADSGNTGMLDLVAALRWVRDNIAAFGGDPGNVTIFGQSGGGGKVSTIMAMPEAAGLFHRAIIQSGSYARNAHLQAMDPDTATRHTRTLLTALDMQPSDAGKLADVPMAAMVEGLAKAGKSAAPPTFRPVADNRALPSGPWLPQAPAISAGVPLMIGTTATEMTMLIGTFVPGTFELDEAGLRARLKWLPADKLEDVITTFRASRPGATPSELFFAISTAGVFRCGAWQQAELKAAQGAAPAYLYEIDWITPVDGGKWQSPHSMEHPFVFDNVALSESMVGKASAQTQAMVDQIGATWLAFARTGNPNNPAVPHWPAYQPAERATMVFDVPPKVVNGFRDDERKVLDGLIGKGPLD